MSSSTTVAPTGSIQPNATIANSTVLVLPQLTTPFVPPTQCTPVQHWTPATVSITTEGHDFGNITYSQILFPVTDAQFSACQPSGWDGIESKNRFRYSSAVCPSGYNYNQLSDLYNGQTNAETIRTTAYCCPSGFAYTFFYETSVGGIFGDNCIRTTSLGGSTNFNSSTTPANNTASASVSPRDVATTTAITTSPGPTIATMLYTPWRITWEKQDATQLSPTPPVVSVQVPVSTWVPGTEIDPSLTRKKVSNPNALSKGLSQVIGIVVGCVVAVFAGVGAFCGWLYVRSRRRRRQEFEREERELQDRRLARLAEYQRSRDPADDEPLPVYVKSRHQDKATGTSVAVPPYKERPSEDSSRDGHHQDERHGSGTGVNNDDDEQRLHDMQIQDNTNHRNARQRRSGRPRRE